MFAELDDNDDGIVSRDELRDQCVMIGMTLHGKAMMALS